MGERKRERKTRRRGRKVESRREQKEGEGRMRDTEQREGKRWRNGKRENIWHFFVPTFLSG